jgi:hypothetical protein
MSIVFGNPKIAVSRITIGAATAVLSAALVAFGSYIGQKNTTIIDDHQTVQELVKATKNQAEINRDQKEINKSLLDNLSEVKDAVHGIHETQSVLSAQFQDIKDLIRRKGAENP